MTNFVREGLLFLTEPSAKVLPLPVSTCLTAYSVTAGR
jgi:hypothetical protein